ncbi:MAG: YIP1 family protein [Candidatus Acidiferrum sp.]
MATSPVPAAEPRASISPLGRIVGVLFSPKATFEDIVRKPTWLLPLVIMAVLGVLAAVSLNQRMNWRDYVSQQIEKSPRASQLTPEQKQQQIEAGAKFAPISVYISVPLVPIVVLLVVTLVMWGGYNLLGGANTNFKTSLGIVSHAFVPSYISSLLFLLVIFLKPVGTVDVQNPVATNVAAFLPDDVPKWLDALCKNVDVFVIWYLLLIAIGFAATNPKKLKGGKSLTIAVSVMAVYLVLRVGIAFILS